MYLGIYKSKSKTTTSTTLCFKFCDLLKISKYFWIISSHTTQLVKSKIQNSGLQDFLVQGNDRSVPGLLRCRKDRSEFLITLIFICGSDTQGYDIVTAIAMNKMSHQLSFPFYYHFFSIYFKILFGYPVLSIYIFQKI